MNKKLQNLLYIINMLLLMVIVSMNVLNVAAPKILLYSISVTVLTYFLLALKNKFS